MSMFVLFCFVFPNIKIIKIQQQQQFLPIFEQNKEKNETFHFQMQQFQPSSIRTHHEKKPNSFPYDYLIFPLKKFSQIKFIIKRRKKRKTFEERIFPFFSKSQNINQKNT